MNKINSLITKKKILVCVIIASIISLIPVLWLSFYTFPIADDFSYGTFTIGKLSGSNIISFIIGIFKNVAFFYNKWQGTYSAIVIFSVSPAIFGSNCYFLTTFIVLGTLFLGLYILLRQVIMKILKLDKISFYIILILFFMASIERLESIYEGLYWWNGSTYYIVFMSLELIEIGLILKKYFTNESSKRTYPLLCIMSFVIAGGNFVTALQQIIILFFINIYIVFKKKDKSLIIPFMLSIIGLVISAIAPGNASRQSQLLKMSAPSAIAYSFYYALQLLRSWINPYIMLMIIFIEICLYPSYQKIKYSFKKPLLWIGLMYCILSAELTPSLYAQSIIGGYRLVNIIYISNLFFIVISVYIIIGYIRKKLYENNILKKDAYKNLLNLIKKHNLSLLIVGCLLLLITIYVSRYQTTSITVLRSIKNREPEIYRNEWRERFKILENDKIKKVEFEKLTVCPEVICKYDLSTDKKDWLNKPLAKIYNKEYVVVKKNKKD